MTDLERLSQCVFNGIQVCEGRHLALFTDPVTQSTFAIKPQETVHDGLMRLKACYAGLEQEYGVDHAAAR